MSSETSPNPPSRALKARAKAHGRSTEAEIRDILEKALAPAEGAATGKEIFDELHALGQGSVELNWKFRRATSLRAPPNLNDHS